MKRKRRTHSLEFKARVAMEALEGINPPHYYAVFFKDPAGIKYEIVNY